MTALVRWVLLSAMFLSGCALFKKTSKTKTTETERIEKKSELNMLDLKSAHRQTSIFTLWDSGMVYQYQVILEKTDEAKLAGIEANEVGTAKKVIDKVSKPWDLWVYLGVGIILIGVYWVYRKI
ncbi:hypothetical protein HDC92_002206 [Pedobacter sp. AK017]|uniref:hypothetical protein n=1 Tax=Pedobacter sp. AK017 TaxID=2723073 RepID=UPI00161901D0|nr:hypothetical protein [Pedobacter sp. AK017]MBB5438530.1 hypothetical protein [Pedobacter sp. AK017]